MKRPELQKLVAVVRAKTVGDPARVERLDDAVFVAAVQECRHAGPLGTRHFATTWQSVAGYVCDSALPLAFARRWNRIPGAPQLDLEDILAPYRAEYSQECERFRAEVSACNLRWLFTEEWFTQVEGAVAAWDGRGPLKMDDATGFIAALQEASSNRSLARELRERLDVISAQSPKAAIIRRRLAALAKDAIDQVSGAVFELTSMYPLVVPPNELVELEPKVGASQKRAEALVRVRGYQLYLEATAFTGVRLLFPGGEAQTLVNKVRTKARQLAAADKPTLVFVARGLVIWGEPLQTAIRIMESDPVCSSVSAVALADSHLCERFELLTLPNATHPLPEDVAGWIRACESSGWRWEEKVSGTVPPGTGRRRGA